MKWNIKSGASKKKIESDEDFLWVRAFDGEFELHVAFIITSADALCAVWFFFFFIHKLCNKWKRTQNWYDRRRILTGFMLFKFLEWVLKKRSLWIYTKVRYFFPRCWELHIKYRKTECNWTNSTMHKTIHSLGNSPGILLKCYFCVCITANNDIYIKL